MIPPTLSRVREHGHALILIAPHWPVMHWLVEIYQLMCAQPCRDLLSQGGRGCFPPALRTPGAVVLAPEWLNLSAVGLSQRVISTIQSARASSTRSLYDRKWRLFEGWCHRNGHIPFQCPVGVILSFFQDLIDKRKAFSTVKVYLAAIAARHVGFRKQTTSQHPLVCRFMKGACRFLPVSRPLVPPWDLAVVLDTTARSYMERTRGVRRSDQLFVSWANPHKGKPVTKQRLSHWVVEAIAFAYTSQGSQSPVGLRAHSTRGLAASWASFSSVIQFRVSVQDICAAASWSSPLTFVCFYMLVCGTSGFVVLTGTEYFCLWVGGHLISLSGNTGATISHSETSSEILIREH
uniref:uncharacterized protein LOC124058723 n=1 Tax=Scatophagus argus TaxID=75038 RepID=UPI001ED7DA94|nr:uncharacterized protein LOC124058723 [Scatophagus argus]XP_046244202.1 uncharacterized protein LOC124058723 [Scatophagus argus]XP_046244204.1 uncharacterized protein LOC124058723 [Scatophagus argus]XP_046244205.1 uncharacterized protein LOC124058723 [Scatophagus argus]XP_046244206.1 uncharacterized protein LOC124058723 [Scatophagus argus]XP_046244207.1 uncharacterized protein LOC124058723 [Scatophagus argus]XP_046244208.1 uncharacterized protein LOC124058723 [Scatophagus argus]XP_04624421